jgi:membrane-associated phospholipid phosphatase
VLVRDWWPVPAALAACVIGHLTLQLPGDVSVARVVQATVPGPGWAEAVTGLARMPMPLALGTLLFLVVWWQGSVRAALVAVAAFAVIWMIGEPIKALVQRPRPSPLLVHVVGSPHGFGFPSTFGTLWGATWLPMLVIAWRRRQTPDGLLVAAVAASALVVGAAARVTLGAHWPSDLLGAYLIALAVWTLATRADAVLGR